MITARFTAEQKRLFREVMERAHKERRRTLASEQTRHGLYDAAYWEFCAWLDAKEER